MSKDTSRGGSQVPGILLGTADLEDGPGLTYLDRGKATMRIDDSTIVGGTIEYDDKYFNEFIGSGRTSMKNKKSPRSPLPPIQLQTSPSNNYLFNMRHLNSTIPVPDKSDILIKNQGKSGVFDPERFKSNKSSQPPTNLDNTIDSKEMNNMFYKTEKEQPKKEL